MNRPRIIAALVAATALAFGTSLPPSSAAVESTPLTVYSAHVQNVGWMPDVEDGAVAGKPGSGLRLEAVKLATSAGTTVTWRGHVQSIGWQAWSATPSTIGTTGKALRLEALQATVQPSSWSIEYRAYVGGVGWQGWARDGQTAGTTGKALRLEAVEIRLVPKEPSTEFAFTADTGIETAGKTVLAKIGSNAPDVTTIVGDLAYAPNAVQTFCDQVNTRVPGAVQIVVGNHEEDGSDDGEIGDYAKCLPDEVGVFGKYTTHNYFDKGGVRVVNTSPDITVDGVRLTYASGTPEREDVKAWVRDAKAKGLWTVLTMHHPCFSLGLHGCSDTTPNLTNLAIGLGVDVVFDGHDHNYMRTHQVRGTVASPVLVDNDNDYRAQTETTKGSVFVTVGNGGHNPRALAKSPTSIWAVANGTTSPGGFAFGYGELTATATRLSYRHVSAYGATLFDSFTVSR